MSEHLCHASGCHLEVPPAKFMCKRHWFMVPRSLRTNINSLYKPGQEITKTPTMEYVIVAQQAVDNVAAQEGAAHGRKKVR